MCERNAQADLANALRLFPSEYVFWDPNTHTILKKIFSKSSKSENGRGIPDAVVFDGDILIVVECKKANLNLALEDLRHYRDRMILDDKSYEIYFVSYVSKNQHEIYDSEFQPTSKTLTVSQFNLKKNQTKSNLDMDQKIHEIHNYIRDHTKISNEDKTFFVASILISIRSEAFRRTMKEYNDRGYIYDFIANNLRVHDIDISVFEFLRTDSNNQYLLTLVRKIIDIYEGFFPDVDLLNSFYSEFVRYGNTDSKSLGIVLTPPHIVKAMVKLANINANDTVLDLCGGTGSFGIEAYKYKPKKIIVCEYQTKLFNLLKCNIILHDIHRSSLVQGNCFNNSFDATKSIINPPYGTKGSEKELDFVLFQLKSLCEGGLAISIIPVSKLHGNKTNQKYKQRILEQADVVSIIRCRKDLFQPVASVHCVILVLKKVPVRPPPKSFHARIVDYEDDGVEWRHHVGWEKTPKFESSFDRMMESATAEHPTHLLQCDDDWGFADLGQRTNITIDLTPWYEEKIEAELRREKERRLRELENVKFELTKYCEKQLADFFYFVKGRESVKEQVGGSVPLISASIKNNGVVDWIEGIAPFSAGAITVGDMGRAILQPQDFNATHHVVVLVPKDEISVNVLRYIVLYLNQTETNYGFVRPRNVHRLKQETVKFPVTEFGEIDFDTLNKLFI